jgi:tRNA(Ile)-lysidine synthase
VQAVLLAHTLDDQAETVLLGLARGSGARSLSGMRPIDGLYRRPLLGVDRATVRASVSDLEIYEDPHNEDRRFARVRVRHDLLPILEATLGPGVSQALARTAEMLRADADALDAIANEIVFEGIVNQIQDLSDAVRTRVLRKFLIDGGVPANDLSREQVLAVDALVTDWHGQKHIDLPGRMNVARESGRLCLTKSVQLNEEK